MAEGGQCQRHQPPQHSPNRQQSIGNRALGRALPIQVKQGIYPTRLYTGGDREGQGLAVDADGGFGLGAGCRSLLYGAGFSGIKPSEQSLRPADGQRRGSHGWLLEGGLWGESPVPAYDSTYFQGTQPPLPDYVCVCWRCPGRW